jgi:hypothetical protein
MNLDQNQTVLGSQLVQVVGLLPSTCKHSTLNLGLSNPNLLSGLTGCKNLLYPLRPFSRRFFSYSEPDDLPLLRSNKKGC